MEKRITLTFAVVTEEEFAEFEQEFNTYGLLHSHAAPIPNPYENFITLSGEKENLQKYIREVYCVGADEECLESLLLELE